MGSQEFTDRQLRERSLNQRIQSEIATRALIEW